jgi:hypothetical protein
MSTPSTPLERIEPIPRGRTLTAAQFHQSADVSPEAEWFANLDNPRTRRAYETCATSWRFRESSSRMSFASSRDRMCSPGAAKLVGAESVEVRGCIHAGSVAVRNAGWLIRWAMISVSASLRLIHQ